MASAQQALRLCCTGFAHLSARAFATSPCASAAAAAAARAVPSQVPTATAAAARHRVTWGDLYKLSKGKLSLIVVTTAAAGFAAASGDRIDAPQLLYTCVGTFGCSAAANALNQVYEIRNDGLMRRTMLRPLPAGRMSAAQALLFAAVMGVGGAGLLAWQVNPLTAALGAGNIALYAAVYTPLKQLHPLNTWVGAVVGAIPPLMGWTAVTNSVDPGAFFMAGILYLWQLPHFMALAWMCKEDYIRGGYRMLSFADPSGRRTAGVALRNALAMVPLGLAAVQLDLVHSPFAYESVALSGAFALSASAFFARPGQQTARMLFRMSLLHLPLYMLLFAVHRVPNTGDLTWPRLLELLQRGTEAAEQRVLRTVHGPEPPVLVEGPMLFPFSPPLVMPCPYRQMKQALRSPARGGDAGAGAARRDVEFRGPLQDFRLQWAEASGSGRAVRLNSARGTAADGEAAQAVLRNAQVSQEPSAPKSAKDLPL